MTDTNHDTRSPVRPFALVGGFVAGVVASGALGGAINVINGWVSPGYFVTIMHWHHVSDVWRASIAQGTFEGLLFGVFFSLVFATGTGIITRASCRFDFAVRHLLGILAGACVCWLLGGVAGMGLASLSPEFYRSTFLDAPPELSSIRAFAWVGGSIWGVELGGLASVILGLVVVRANWRQSQTHAIGPGAVV
ncbi:MAG: hypothetical protein ACKV0T_26950 [Planctomycetales bacterium]